LNIKTQKSTQNYNDQKKRKKEDLHKSLSQTVLCQKRLYQMTEQMTRMQICLNHPNK